MARFPIPVTIERDSSGMERVYDIYSRLLKDRIIFIQAEISDVYANSIIAQLLFLQAVDPAADITLYINSAGGSVYSGLAIVDTMNHISCEVSTIAIGMAASMASIILSAGVKGKRYALPHASVLMHQPFGKHQGQAADIEIQAKEILRLRDVCAEILAKNTNNEKEKILKDFDRDFILTPEDAQAYGFIDKII